MTDKSSIADADVGAVLNTKPIAKAANLFKLKKNENELSGDDTELPSPLNSSVAQAEIAILGMILKSNELYFSVAEKLLPDDFFEIQSKKVFVGISQILEGNFGSITVADPLTVSSIPGISQFISYKTINSWQINATISGNDDDLSRLCSYIGLIENASAERELVKFQEQASSVIGSASSPQEKSEKIAAALEEKTRQNKASNNVIKKAGDCAVNAINSMLEHAKSGRAIVGIPTGMSDLDLMLSGLCDGDLIVVAARPSIGKTAFVLSALNNATKQGYGGLMYSLEMTGEKLASRLISIVSGVDGQKIRSGALDKGEWEMVFESQKTIKDLPLYFNDAVDTTLSGLRKEVIKLKKSVDINLLAVDYLQLMTGTSKENRQAQISEMSRGLKKLAMELKIPVIVLSQLNRGLENRADKTPQLSDLRESGAIEQDADVIIFLHQPDVNDCEFASHKKMEAIVAKQRSGPVGTVPLLFHSSTTEYSSFDDSCL